MFGIHVFMPLCASLHEASITSRSGLMARAQCDAPMTIHDTVSAQALRRPSAPAVISGNAVLTFRQLDDQSNQVARALLDLGLAPATQTPVGVCINGPLSIVTLLAVMKTGNPYVPLDPDYPLGRIQYMVADAGLTLIATSAYIVRTGILKGEWFTGRVLQVDAQWATAVGPHSAAPLPVAVGPDALAYVLYTSGSTGYPKGVCGPHAAALNRCRWQWRAVPFEPGDVCIQKTSYSFVDHVFETFGALGQGVPLVVCPKAARADAAALLRECAAHRVTRLIVVPSLLRVLLQAPRPLAEALLHLRLCTASGEALPWALARAFLRAGPVRLLNLYGSTEVAGDVTCEVVSDAVRDDAGLAPSGCIPRENNEDRDGSDGKGRGHDAQPRGPRDVDNGAAEPTPRVPSEGHGPGPADGTAEPPVAGAACSALVPVGTAIDNTEVVAVRAASSADVPSELWQVAAGESGEIVVFGANIAAGYWGKPQLTAAQFVRVLPTAEGHRADGARHWRVIAADDEAGTRAFLTGDLGHMDHAGRLHLIGRKDQQVKIRGNRVDLLEVEAQLLQAPGVRTACVVTRDELKRIVAFVSPAAADVDEALAHLRRALPAYMIPSRIWALEQLPQLPNGKTDRAAVAIMGQSGQFRGRETKRHGVKVDPPAPAARDSARDTARIRELLQSVIVEVVRRSGLVGPAREAEGALHGASICGNPKVVAAAAATDTAMATAGTQTTAIVSHVSRGSAGPEAGNEATSAVPGEVAHKGGETRPVCDDDSRGDVGAGVRETAAAAVPEDVPLADLGLDSLDAMILKQHLLKALAQAYPQAHFPAHALTLDPTMLDWLTLHTLALQLEACVAAQTSGPAPAPAPAPLVLERDRRTPLAELRAGGIAACACGDLDAVRALVRSGGWDARYAVDRNGSTALMWAAGEGHLDVVQCLIRDTAVDVDAQNKKERTALMQAAKGGHVAVVRWLLEEGGADPHRVMKDGSRVFDWAVMGGSTDVMDYLAGHPQIDIHARNLHECTAVHWATATGNVKVCQWLYARGFDFHAINKSKHSALNQAAWKGHRELLEWLLLAPDGPGLTGQLSLQDHGGLTVMQLARLAGHMVLADWLQAVADTQVCFPHEDGPGNLATRNQENHGKPERE